MNYFIVCENYKNTGVEKKVTGQRKALQKIGNYKFIGFSEDRIFPRIFIAPFKIILRLKNVEKIYYRYSSLNIFIHLFLILFYRGNYYLEINTKNRDELQLSENKTLKNRIKYLFNLICEKSLYKNAYRIITFTEERKDYINNIYENNKTAVIQNGYYSGLSEKKEVKIKDKKLIKILKNEDKKIAVFAGTFFRWSGVDKIIDLIKDLEDIFLIIFGFGSEKEKIINKIESENINNVYYYGRASRLILNRVYEDCDLAFASFSVEKKGMKQDSTLKMREYLMNGLPVIYNYYENKELENAKFILNMKENTREDLANFVKNIDKIDKNRIKNFARKEFDWEKIMRKVIDIS